MISEKDFLNDMTKHILDEKISLFLGAGISCSAGYPTWASLLKECAEEIGIQINNTMNLYLLAQYYANAKGYNELKKIVNENINSFGENSTLVDNLLQFNFKTIWTTNYDTTIEKNLEQRRILSNAIYDDADLVNINPNNRVNIYKLNGDINNLKNIVITQSDLEDYMEKHKILLTFLKKELVSNTFLFLGYSFKDTLALSCLSEINQCLGDASNFHYAILPKDNEDPCFEMFVEDLEKRYHVKTLVVNTYDDISLILQKLNFSVCRKKIFISGAFDSITSAEEQFATKLCHDLIFQILDKKFRIISGMGYRLGNFIGGYGLDYLAQKNKTYDIERYLLMRPMPVHTTEDERVVYRTELIQQANISLFMFGQSSRNSSNHFSEGVWEEYQISKKLNKYIIPIGTSGYESKLIWEDVKKHITQYPYLETYIDYLNTEKKDVEKISKVIITILNNISQTTFFER